MYRWDEFHPLKETVGFKRFVKSFWALIGPILVTFVILYVIWTLEIVIKSIDYSS
jgi:hypothetical protein